MTYELARATDPLTSHAAAARSRVFAKTHRDRIFDALRTSSTTYDQGHCDHWGVTAKEIAAMTGLTVVQIDRRLPELERDGLVTVSGDENGKDLVVDGCRVWELT